ncbi:MAG TPA: DegV family protein [Chloroflexi bacterium]|nr:DegV family protein [Chloroflexota bacterium]
MVHIVTDATVRFTLPGFEKEHDIVIVPTGVRCGNIQIPEGPDTDLATVRPMLEVCGPDLKLECPTVEDMRRVYSDLQTETSQILSIHHAASISPTYQHALEASQLFRGRLDIQVVDSQSISLGLGLLVQALAHMAERGDALDGLVRLVRGLIPRLYMVIFLEDLTFIERNGLISRSQAILGNMLGILPFLTMEDGHLIAMEKVRTRTRAIEKLIEFISEFSALEQIGILQSHAAPSEETEMLAERLRALYPSTPISSACYGPVLSTVVGYDGLGAVVLEAKENLP